MNSIALRTHVGSDGRLQPDIALLRLEIYRDPADGRYRQRDCLRAGRVAPLLCLEAAIDLAELFPNL